MIRQKLSEAWGKLRRQALVYGRRGYVAARMRDRQGQCNRCGTCCALLNRCPFYSENGCKIYAWRPRVCRAFPVDTRDMQWAGKNCGFFFSSSDGVLRGDSGRYSGEHAENAIRMRLTPYGKREILLSSLAAGALFVAALFVAPYLAAIPVVLWLGVALFFRDPERSIPGEKDCLVAPADGRVVGVEEVEEHGFIGGPAVKVSIFLSLLDVHINRAPCAGRVEYLRHEAGRFHVASRREASKQNESNCIGIVAQRPEGARILVKQIAGAVARRIVCDCEERDTLERGQRIGMIKFGSRTEIFVPNAIVKEIRVKPGDKVRGGQTVLGVIQCAE